MTKMVKFERYILLIILFVMVFTVESHATGKITLPQAWKEFMDEWKIVIGYIEAFGLFTSILIFILQMIKLGSLPNHPVQRRACMQNILVSLVCTALLGGVGILWILYCGAILI